MHLALRGALISLFFILRRQRILASCYGSSVTHLTATRTNQDITSPNYPYNYPQNSNCRWQISTYADYILLTFDDIDIEPGNSCGYDHVDVFSGDSAITRNRLGRFCSTSNKYHTLRAYSKKVFVRFESDNSNERKGFKMSYRGVYSTTPAPATCGNSPENLWAYGYEQTFTSPGYPYSYPANTECEWLIRTYYDGGNIQLTFDDIDLETGSSCNYDHVDVFTGNSANYDYRLGRFCSTSLISHTVHTNSRTVLVRFQTDGSGQEKGFKITYRDFNDDTTRPSDDDDSGGSSLPIYVPVLIAVAAIIFFVAVVCVCRFACCHGKKQIHPGQPQQQAQPPRPQQQYAGYQLAPVSTISFPQTAAPQITEYHSHVPNFQQGVPSPNYSGAVNMIQNFVEGSNLGVLADGSVPDVSNMEDSGDIDDAM